MTAEVAEPRVPDVIVEGRLLYNTQAISINSTKHRHHVSSVAVALFDDI